MSYVSKQQLEERNKRERTTADKQIPGFGLAKLQTLSAREFIRIDAAHNRAVLAAARGDTKAQEAALSDELVELAKACFLEPAFTEADRDLLLGLDSSVADAVRQACYEHCNIEEANLENAQKN